MTILLQLFEIITLKRQPKDLDYDEFAAIFYVVASIGLGYIGSSLQGQYSSPLAFSATQSLGLAAALFGILTLTNKRNRYVQTCTALFGISTLLGVVSMAVVYIPGLSILFLFVTGWIFYISVLILRDALEISTLRAVFALIGIQLISLMILITLFPDFINELQQLLEQAESQNSNK